MIIVRNHEKTLKDFNTYVENLIKENNLLREKLRDFRKDYEIQKLEQENSNLRRLSVTIMSEKEYEDSKVFRQKHYKQCKSNSRHIAESGGGFGSVIKVQCEKCKEIKDVT